MGIKKPRSFGEKIGKKQLKMQVLEAVSRELSTPDELHLWMEQEAIPRLPLSLHR